MGGDEHGAARRAPAASTAADDEVGVRLVLVAGRLVEDDDVGPERGGPGDGDPLLLAARRLTREPVGEVSQVEGLQQVGPPG